MGEKTHAGSKEALIGKTAGADIIDKYSIEKQVTANYPASFIWQFDNDNMVPVDNSRMISAALKEKGVPAEYITYPGTLHGAGLGTGTACEGWLKKAVGFWESRNIAG